MSIRKEQTKGSSIFYLIDEENKVVEAKMLTNILIDDVFDAMNKWGLDFNTNIIRKNQELWTKYFVGRAKCSPEDTFDIEKGKELARKRMLKKYYKVRTKIFGQIAEEFSDNLMHVEDQLNYCWLASNDLVESIRDLSK